MSNQQNVSGINFERGDPRPPHRSMVVRIVSIGLIVLAMVFVAFQLFNPIKPRPSLTEYVERYNATAEKQHIPDKLPVIPSGLVNGSAGIWRNSLPSAGMALELLYDGTGYITGATLSDEAAGPAQSNWLAQTPRQVRNQIFLVIYSIDPKQSISGLYRSFDLLGLDLDQPITSQTAGTSEVSTDGFNLTLTRDSLHFKLSIRLDVLTE